MTLTTKECINPASPFTILAMQDKAIDDKSHSTNTKLLTVL